MEDIVNLVSNMGFPIAACCAMFVQMRKSDALHIECYQQLKEALDHNTEVLRTIKERIRNDG